MPEFLPFIVGPLVGAVIGYFTNYLAVRMLFRPFRPVCIGRFRLPFTPGIIPKRKGELARALGHAVGTRLLTGEDLSGLLATGETVDRVASAITDALLGEKGPSEATLPVISCPPDPDEGETSVSVEEIGVPLSVRLASLLGAEQAEGLKERLDDALTVAVVKSLSSPELGKRIVSEGGDAIRSAAPAILSMFLSDKFLDSLADPLGEKLRQYLSENGHALIRPSVERETSRLLSSDAEAILGAAGLSREKIKALAERICEDFLGKYLVPILGGIDIAGAVEKKINDMDVPDLERLLLAVMKRELGAVVNLGAVIGLVLGVVTAFF